jgi:uncharacterized protein (TIGR00369 family)
MTTLDDLNARMMPFSKLMGVRLTHAEPARVAGVMIVRPDLCTAGDIAHGGALMAFADTLGAVAAFLNLPAGARTTTLESKTNFIAAGKAGDELAGEATPIHVGRRASVWQTRVTNPDGKLVALVTQTQMVLPP